MGIMKSSFICFLMGKDQTFLDCFNLKTKSIKKIKYIPWDITTLEIMAGIMEWEAEFFFFHFVFCFFPKKETITDFKGKTNKTYQNSEYGQHYADSTVQNTTKESVLHW